MSPMPTLKQEVKAPLEKKFPHRGKAGCEEETKQKQILEAAKETKQPTTLLSGAK